MQIDYTDMTDVERSLTVGAALFTLKKTAHTHFAETDRRDKVEITHLGVASDFTFRIPRIFESEIADIKRFLSAVENCNTFTVTDPDNTMPEYDFPMTLVRTAKTIPTLQRIPPTKIYTLTVSAKQIF